MVKKLTDKEAQQLGLSEAYYDKLDAEGSTIGTLFDVGGGVFDFLGKINLANLKKNVAKKRIDEGQSIIDAAGKGAEDRLESERAAKTAVATQAAKELATQAAQDTTGATAVEVARRIPGMIQGSTDVSQSRTAEMEQELREKALGLQRKSEGENLKLAAKHEKQQARLGMIKEGFDAAGRLAQAAKPLTYEAKQESIAKRQGLKQKRLGKKIGTEGASKSELADIRDAIASGEVDKRSALTPGKDKKGVFRTKTYGERLESSKEKQSQALQNLEELQRARIKKLQNQYGSQFASLLENPKPTETAEGT